MSINGAVAQLAWPSPLNRGSDADGDKVGGVSSQMASPTGKCVPNAWWRFLKSVFTRAFR
jgi:hypothetical protein